LPVEGSNAWTASLLSVDPPPNTNRSLPIISPAASWNACGTLPTCAMCPVCGEKAKTPLVEVPFASRPPAIKICFPSFTATARWTGAGSWWAAGTSLTVVTPEGEGPVDGWMELAGGAVVVVPDCGEMLEVQAKRVTSTRGAIRRIVVPARAAIEREPRGHVWRSRVGTVGAP
jgi:hypothetical protein